MPIPLSLSGHTDSPLRSHVKYEEALAVLNEYICCQSDADLMVQMGLEPDSDCPELYSAVSALWQNMGVRIT